MLILDKLNTFINKIEIIAQDPERFLTDNYQKKRSLNSFRIELIAAKTYNSVCRNIKWPTLTNLKAVDIIPEQKSSRPKGTFCPYCEKTVVPKRLHKLDFADIVVALFTAGLWAVFIFIMYLFIRRCPVCNYNLRGFKFLSNKKRR